MKRPKDFNNGIIKDLQSLGLTEEQARVFLVLFNNSSMSVVQISHLLNWGRNKIYRILQELEQIGLVASIKKRFGSTYKSLDIQSLQFLVESKKRQYTKAKKGLSNLLNTLPYLQNASNISSKVIHYRGINGLKQVNWNLIHAKGIYRVYEVSRLSDYLDEDFAENLRLEWLRRKIHSRDLTNDKFIDDHTHVVEFTTKFSEYRYIDPKILEIDTEIYIYNNIVTILQYDSLKYDPNSIFCVEIYNQALADFQKQIYDIIWNLAKPLKLVSKFGKRILN